ncbi:chemotaxis protein [Pseudomonas sp. RW409]|uniref:chemotaxis protein n=1 Tax=Pseudomonas sp. RW409 TaxID=2202895 RepID=UPI000D725995|nr:chemotaxis protein [Pseudomonas sp. RW409]PWY37980.1 chemotaxis protein [Pseudomonas sp. RW409]
MKLVFREYLASLRERRELDVVLPDLLSELGYTVISRPSVGTRQFGVDVAAIGSDDDGEEKVFLFSIKQGDLLRADWDGTPQALRSSINDIIDFYIPVRIPEQHKQLKIVICLCFGGDVHEAVRDNLTQFTKSLTNDRVSFQEWNGDYLAGQLSKGVLRQQLVDKKLRSSFQKSVAMLDEPDIAYKHFSHLLNGLLSAENLTPQTRLTSLRQTYICLWVLFVWARDAGNLEAPYRSSELAILKAWDHIKTDIEIGKKLSEDIGITFAELVDLHFQIWDELLGKKILPYVHLRHGISSAVNSATPVDVSLKLFETLGRITQRGLWILWRQSWDDTVPTPYLDNTLQEAEILASQVRNLIENNPCLLSPMADEHSIDIVVAVIFLSMMKKWQPLAQSYCDYLLENYLLSYSTHGRYPTIHGSYRNLISHPQEQTEEYRKSQTKGSTLLPLVSVWASSRGETVNSREFSNFAKEDLKHCNMQFWIPGVDSEEHIYKGLTSHGMALTDVPITANGNAAMDMLESETTHDEHFNNLSAIQLGHWPILVMACRHHRLPLPPQLWLPLLKNVRGCSFPIESRGSDNAPT